jgi:NitT/TauT family transport system substrate-binding protein
MKAKFLSRAARICTLAVVFAIGAIQTSYAAELKIATQFGLTYLPLLIMQQDRLIEKHAQKSGAGDITVEWGQFASGSVMNDALLSGRLNIVPASVPAFLTLWSKTKDTSNAVIGICALNSLPLFMNTRNPRVKSVSDLSASDKIALPAVKVSTFAIALQMAAAKLYGDANYTRFDGLTVSMPHPDAMAALLSGGGEVNAHFTSPPFNFQELQDPRIHKVMDARDVFGGPVSFAINYTTAKYQRENPKVVAAFLAAFEEATAQINEDKRKAAERYIALTKSKASVELIQEILTHRDTDFTLAPQGTMQIAIFMQRVGSIGVKPASWQELFVSDVHNRPGS